jgi:hypothetical protein
MLQFLFACSAIRHCALFLSRQTANKGLDKIFELATTHGRDNALKKSINHWVLDVWRMEDEK